MVLLKLGLFAVFLVPALSPTASAGPRQEASPQDTPGATVSAASHDADSLVLPDGTPVPIKVVTGFSSETAKAGDVIHFVVAYEVREEGLVVVPQGTGFVGKVLSVTRPRRRSRDGRVSVAFDAMTLPTGETVTLRSILKPPRKAAMAAQDAADAAAGAAGLFITAGIPLVMLFVKGDEQVVQEGTIEVLYLNGPVQLSRKAVTAVQPDTVSAHANVFVYLEGKWRRTEVVVPELYCGEKRIEAYRGEPLRLQLRPGSYWFSTNDPKDHPIRLDIVAGHEYSVGSADYGLFAREDKLRAKRRHYRPRLIDEDWTKLPPEEYRSLLAEPATKGKESASQHD